MVIRFCERKKEQDEKDDDQDLILPTLNLQNDSRGQAPQSHKLSFALRCYYKFWIVKKISEIRISVQTSLGFSSDELFLKTKKQVTLTCFFDNQLIANWIAGLLPHRNANACMYANVIQVRQCIGFKRHDIVRSTNGKS